VPGLILGRKGGGDRAAKATRLRYRGVVAGLARVSTTEAKGRSENERVMGLGDGLGLMMEVAWAERRSVQ